MMLPEAGAREGTFAFLAAGTSGLPLVAFA